MGESAARQDRPTKLTAELTPEPPGKLRPKLRRKRYASGIQIGGIRPWYPLPAGKQAGVNAWVNRQGSGCAGSETGGVKHPGNSGRAVSSSGMPGSPHEPGCAYLGKLVLRPCRTGRACSGKLWCVPLALHRHRDILTTRPSSTTRQSEGVRTTLRLGGGACDLCALRGGCVRACAPNFQR